MPVPSGVTVAEIRLAQKLAVRHIDKVVRDRDAHPHAGWFVAPLVLARPPDARAFSFARGIDPVFAGGVFLEGDAAEAAHFPGLTGIIEVDRIFATLTQRFRKVD